MTLPKYFVVDSLMHVFVTYYFQSGSNTWACMEYTIDKNYKRGSWKGSFFESRENIELDWEYWIESDAVVEYETPADEDLLEVAREMMSKLIFK